MEVKICGLTNVEDAQVAVAAGADYLGFILYKESPRAVTPQQITHILSALGNGIRAVGVFVNEVPSQVEAIAKDCGLYAVQIHGDEDAGGFVDFSIPVWRALWVRDGGAHPDPIVWPASRYVIDAAVPGQYGGTGVAADWNEAADIAKECPVMLAGGLHPANVAEAIRSVRPMGVDVSSGVECDPGRKDHDAIRTFVAAAKNLK